ncbi:MAG TPA: helix-turn-helix domain-containing protein [Sandaracinaceae bacterium LLY-WYZ-13_1]|nr:helix-turn-helix domain-containing protein [Sandaracinaceae bacterium LLY-WYZ-13_1]
MIHEMTGAAAKRPKKRKGKRAARREATMARIVDAALVILTEEGFDALTMKRLADELGYAIGAFYRYFPSKDALFLAVQRRVLELLAADLRRTDEAVRAQVDDDEGRSARTAALTRILAAARVYETLATRRPVHFRLLGRWLGDTSPLVSMEAAAPLLPALLEMFGLVPRLFEAAVEAGALTPGPADRRAYVLWSSLQGVSQLRKLSRFGVAALEPRGMAEELVRTLLSGWGAAEPSLSEALTLARALVAEELEGSDGSEGRERPC